MNLLEILKFSEEYLKKFSFPKARLESEKLIAHVLNLDRMTLYLNFDKTLSENEKNQIKKYLSEMTKENSSFSSLKKDEVVFDYKAENLNLINKSISYLEKYSVPNAKLDCEYIFSFVLNIKRNMLNFNLTRKIEDEQKDKIRTMIVERGKYRKPLQYILGEWDFFGYTFTVDSRALIPRNDTEILVEQCKILMLDIKNSNILDIGSGSGAISISLGKELPTSNILGVDISENAIKLALENKERHNCENVNFLTSDLFSNVNFKDFDLIVSNPPYISLKDYMQLMPEVKNYEPKNALTDNNSGYFFYEAISKNAGNFLKDSGFLVFELGVGQAETVSEIMKKNKFDIISIVKDYSNIERVIIGRKSVDNVN